MRRRQRGLASAIFLAVMLLAIVGLGASYLLSRLTETADDQSSTARRLASAAEKLEQFAATAARLPCPADPTLNTGVEVLPGVGSATCSFPEGTIPWTTIGLKRDDAYDGWGRKISYRVYTGTAGSLTQPGGVSMVECDTNEPTTGARTGGAGSLGGLCVSSTDPYKRSTTPAKFLANKGLTLNDLGTNRSDVAYVVLSHGRTGYGAYTASGARLTLPVGDERNNLNATGAFTIKAFSDADTEASKGTHFDDLLVYRTIPDLAKATSLAARDWPDHMTVVFDNATIATAIGTSGTMSSGSTGTSSIAVGGATIYGLVGTTATPISYDESFGGVGGLGVYGNPVLGYGSNLMFSNFNEALRFDLSQKLRKFAITLNDFGIPTYAFYGTKKYTERVQLTFYDTTSATPLVPVQTTIKSACQEPDGILASYSIDVSADFNRIEVKPITATHIAGGAPTTADNIPTGMLISAFTACTAAISSCTTPLATTGTGGNTCS